MIEKMCKTHTLLTKDDIFVIQEKAQKILVKQKYSEYDVFIDIFDELNNVAIVAFQRAPIENSSLYTRNIVGEKMLRKNEPAVYRTFETSLESIDLLAITPENKRIRQIVYPIRNREKNIAVLIIEKPISELIKNEKITLISEQSIFKRKYIMDEIAQGVLYFDEKGILQDANEVAKNLYQEFGYLDNILGMHYDNLSIDFSTFKQMCYTHSLEKVKDSLVKEVFFDEKYFELKTIFVDDSLFVSLIRDITDIKQKEVEIVDKSVAIREIHHRVKNNLQSVISLLRIQSRMSEHEETKQVLADSINRMMAISSTHELLSQQLSDDIALSEVIEKVVDNIVRGYTGELKLSVNLELEPIVLSSDQTVTISMIINELLQNCYDHAFQGRLIGTITIKIVEEQPHKICIQVIDDGVGFNKDANASFSGLGTQIIQGYVKDKLRGTIEWQTGSNGTEILIEFMKK